MRRIIKRGGGRVREEGGKKEKGEVGESREKRG